MGRGGGAGMLRISALHSSHTLLPLTCSRVGRGGQDEAVGWDGHRYGMGSQNGKGYSATARHVQLQPAQLDTAPLLQAGLANG